MLKRVVSAFGQWFSPDKNGAEEGFSPTRRGFFRKAGAGAAAVTGIGVLAKTAADALPKQDQGELYRQTNRSGEQELLERVHVLMSEQEKDQMVQGFIDSYSRKG